MVLQRFFEIGQGQLGRFRHQVTPAAVGISGSVRLDLQGALVPLARLRLAAELDQLLRLLDSPVALHRPE